MTSASGDSRSFKKFVAWVAVAIVLLLLWDRWSGTLAVMGLCKQDGGERIFETTFVPGYLDDSDDYYCLRCIEFLGNLKFEYIDANVRNAPKRFNSTHLRYSLGRKGDAQCEDWSARPAVASFARRSGISDAECVLVASLSEPVVGYAFTNSRSTRRVMGAEIYVSQWRVEDLSRSRVLAVVKNYQYISKLTELMDMSGHGGNPDASCLHSPDYARIVSTLSYRVLRDPEKKASSTEK